ncbi:MAG TPA: HD domain-containing protein [bacterium]
MSGKPGLDKDQAARLLHAIRFAAEQHRDDRRKGAISAPYINHPITVAEQLAAVGLGDDTDLLISAVLHDVVEDTGATGEQLERMFGPEVAAVVLEVSDDKSLEKNERKRLVVETIGQKSRTARLVKLSDLIANVYDVIHHPPPWTRERKLTYLTWADSCAKAMRGTHPELERKLVDLIEDGRQRLGYE